MNDAARPVTGDDRSPAPGPAVSLDRWAGTWTADDAHADLKADVVAYANLDPLETLTGLSRASGIPVGALARYVLARWASGGSESLLELGVSGVDHLTRTIRDAEAAGTNEARLAAYEVVREVVEWLRAGLNDAGLNDAGLNDAGLNDAGLNDAGLNDAGLDDASLDDAGLNDAGPNDAGPNDAGRDDAGHDGRE